MTGATPTLTNRANCWCAAPAPTRAGAFFREYLKNPQATAEAWDGGWLHTGDVVLRTNDGDFRFIDRKKNVIRAVGREYLGGGDRERFGPD